MALVTRPTASPPLRMAWLVLIAALTLIVAASVAIMGARLLTSLHPDKGRNAVPPATIAHGADAVFAYSVFERGDYNGDVYTVKADGTDKRHVGRGIDPIFSPDGTKIAFYSSFPTSQGWDLMVADAGGVRLLAENIGCHGYGAHGAPVWSPDSRFIIYLVYRGYSADCLSLDSNFALQDFYVIPADGSSHGHRMLASSESGVDSAWSPSGKQIAFQATDGVESSLRVADVADLSAPWGLQSRQLSKPGNYSAQSWQLPRWSPDESMIATTTLPPGDTVAADTVVLKADGTKETVLWPTPTDEDDGSPEWSPDGSRLSVTAHLGAGLATDAYQLYLLAPDGTDPQLVAAPALSGYSGGTPFSPDGTRVIGKNPGNNGNGGTSSGGLLYVITLDGSTQPVSMSDGVTAVSWQPVVAPLPPEQPYDAPVVTMAP